MRRLIIDFYQKLSLGAELVYSLRRHDEQIAQLRAVIAGILGDSHHLNEDQRRAAVTNIESLLAYQAISYRETEGLRAQYEAALARVAKAEHEVAQLRRRVEYLERPAATKDSGDQS